MAAVHEYRPDYAVPPGWVLEERLEAQGESLRLKNGCLWPEFKLCKPYV